MSITPNKENLRLWVAALRSGDFTQTTGALEELQDDDTVRHCCLGVVCRVALKNGLELDVTNASPIAPMAKFDGEHGYLPQKVRDWLGITGRDPQLLFEGDFHGAAALNDSTDKNLTFNDIADLIEKTFELNEVENAE